MAPKSQERIRAHYAGAARGQDRLSESSVS